MYALHRYKKKKKVTKNKKKAENKMNIIRQIAKHSPMQTSSFL